MASQVSKFLSMTGIDLDAELAKARALNHELQSILQEQVGAEGRHFAQSPAPNYETSQQGPAGSPIPFAEEHAWKGWSSGPQNHLVLCDIYEFASCNILDEEQTTNHVHQLPPILEGSSSPSSLQDEQKACAVASTPPRTIQPQPQVRLGQLDSSVDKNGPQTCSRYMVRQGVDWQFDKCKPKRERAARHQLTFSAAPHVPKAKPLYRVNYSHSPGRMVEIEQENKHLVYRLQRISGASSSSTKSRPIAHRLPQNPQHTTNGQRPPFHSGVLRQQQASRVAKENVAMYKRLQQVKPSSEVRKRCHHEFEMKHEVYRKLRQVHNQFLNGR